jgi:hypothetical protein
MNKDYSTMKNATVANRIYQLLFDDEDARVCKDIPEESCTNVPQNFFYIGLTQTLTKLADELANAKTILPWLMSAAGAAPFWIGFLVPVRESLSMLPQLVIASFVRSYPQRKFVWALGAALQAIPLMLIAFIPLWLHGSYTGALLVGLVAIYSLARGLCSVAHKDVIGKTVPKTRRGRLTGYAAAVSGVLTLGLGLFLVAKIGANAPVWLFAVLLSASAALWLGSALLFLLIREEPGATEGGGNAFTEAVQRLAILKTDAGFRKFVIVRALLISSALAAPYYVMLAQSTGGGGELLGFFVLASGLASSVSSAFWGIFSDRSSRNVLLCAAILASTLGVFMFILDKTGLLHSGLGWLTPLAFFLLSIAHSGIRIGRKTYILDLAGGTKRTDYVAVSNTVIGAILLCAGFLGALTPWVGISGMLLLLSVIGFIGAAVGYNLPDVE